MKSVNMFICHAKVLPKTSEAQSWAGWGGYWWRGWEGGWGWNKVDQAWVQNDEPVTADIPQSKSAKQCVKMKSHIASQDAQHLVEYIITKSYHIIWDKFFDNANKHQLYSFCWSTVSWPMIAGDPGFPKPLGELCCDNCKPKNIQIDVILSDD